jgi:hypothetical protein
MQNLCFRTECTDSGYRSCEASILLNWTQNDVWECFGVFHRPWTGKKMQNLCFRTECTVLGYRSCEHPFYSVGPQMMFGSVSEHFTNRRHVKKCKTCVSGLTLFRGTEVVKHPFYSIGPKLMFGSVSEHFANLRHVRRCKTCVRASMHYFLVPKS